MYGKHTVRFPINELKVDIVPILDGYYKDRHQ